MSEHKLNPYSAILNNCHLSHLKHAFLVAYISKGADCSDQPQVVLINGGVNIKAQI